MGAGMTAEIVPFPTDGLTFWRRVDAILLAAREPPAKMGEMTPHYKMRRTVADTAAAIIAGRHVPILKEGSP